jgi:hypothetical protein
VEVGRLLARVLQDGRLAGARLAAHDEGAAVRPARRVEQRPDLCALGVPPVQHRPILRAGGSAIHSPAPGVGDAPD